MKLSVQDLNSHYGPAHILFDIALEVGDGEVVALLGRNGAGKTTTFRTYFVTSRPAERLNPLQILFLRRNQWGIEATCHQRLDVSLHEDKPRVRSPSGVAVLGLLSRISLALFQQDCQRPQPVRDKTYPIWSGRLIRRPRPMLDLFLKRCLPP